MRKYCSLVVVENFFEPCILYLLLKESGYGYELIQKLNKECDCNVNIGNLYRKLNKLAKDGHITKQKTKGTKGPDKTMYTITKSGKTLLSDWIVNLKEQEKKIHTLITHYQKHI